MREEKEIFLFRLDQRNLPCSITSMHMQLLSMTSSIQDTDILVICSHVNGSLSDKPVTGWLNVLCDMGCERERERNSLFSTTAVAGEPSSPATGRRSGASRTTPKTTGSPQLGWWRRGVCDQNAHLFVGCRAQKKGSIKGKQGNECTGQLHFILGVGWGGGEATEQ